MKLRKNWDRTSTPIESTKFVEQICVEESLYHDDPLRAMEGRNAVLTKFCQTLFDVLPEKTRARIAADFGWEPVE